MASSSEPMIESNPVNQAQVRKALESLNTRKASGYDNMPARVLKYGAEKLAIPLAICTIHVLQIDNGQTTGKGGNGRPSLRKRIHKIVGTIDQ